ncbi:MAG TPA: hypothetical protein VGK61_03865 [Planctomycetota bacterium]
MRCSWLLLIAFAQDPDAHRAGSFAVTFKERHPLSVLKEMCRRQGWKEAEVRKNEPGLEGMKIEDESFEVVVPESYAPEKSFGLLVWISPGDSGVVPREWHEALAKRNLIAVGADNSGNSRGVAYRIGFALDAVHNLSRRYSIDRKRIYVTGFSGGGRTASRVGLAYADIFTGGIYQGGMDFYKAVADPADAKKEFRPTFVKPEGDLLIKARMESRHVVLVGQADFNRPSSKAIFDVMSKQERFTRTTYVELPGKGHEPADAETLGKALDTLDAPLKEEKPKK